MKYSSVERVQKLPEAALLAAWRTCIRFLLPAIVMSISHFAQARTTSEEVVRLVEHHLAPHPRLLLPPGMDSNTAISVSGDALIESLTPQPKATAAALFVPARKDDFAWENDRGFEWTSAGCIQNKSDWLGALSAQSRIIKNLP